MAFSKNPSVGSSPGLLDMLSVSSLVSVSQYAARCSLFRSLSFSQGTHSVDSHKDNPQQAPLWRVPFALQKVTISYLDIGELSAS